MTPQPVDPHTAQEWQAEEKTYVLHTWTAQSQWNAPTVTGGSGAWFWDDQGRRYLDLSAMAECSHLGHQHPAVIQAIKRQAEEMMFVTSGWGNRTRAMLAKKVVERAQMPGGKVFFALGGAEANENAIKMARWVTGRQKVITRHRSYHGATAGAISLTGDYRRWADLQATLQQRRRTALVLDANLGRLAEQLVTIRIVSIIAVLPRPRFKRLLLSHALQDVLLVGVRVDVHESLRLK